MSNVLLIEDDRFLIEDLKAFIEFDGHTCTIYTGPDMVIDIKPNSDPNLCFSIRG